jgi:hypothetical protein
MENFVDVTCFNGENEQEEIVCVISDILKSIEVFRDASQFACGDLCVLLPALRFEAIIALLAGDKLPKGTHFTQLLIDADYLGAINEDTIGIFAKYIYLTIDQMSDIDLFRM